MAETDAIIDLEERKEQSERDQEQREADEFALELLTGQKSPSLKCASSPKSGLDLACAVNSASGGRQIETGTLALCYGYQTSDWKTAYAALSHVYKPKQDVWRFLNATAAEQLDWTAYKDDEEAYIRAVIGAI